jgi:hypothetical protein
MVELIKESAAFITAIAALVSAVAGLAKLARKKPPDQ